MYPPALRLSGAARAALALALASAPGFALAQAAASDASQAEPARIDSTSPTCQPVYPAASLKAGVAGTTTVRLAITATGQLTRVEVVHVSGPSLEHRLLDYAFEQALASCPYSPGRDGQGRAVGGTITATHVWKLPDAAAR